MATRRLMQELQSQMQRQDGHREARIRSSTQIAVRPRQAHDTPRHFVPQARPTGSSTAQRTAKPQTHRNLRLLEQLKASTPAKVGIGRAGLRYRTETLLQFMADFAVAQAAVDGNSRRQATNRPRFQVECGAGAAVLDR